MVRPLEKRAAEGLLPIALGSLTLEELDVGPITSVMPLTGARAALDATLLDLVGARFPDPGRVERGGETRIVWSGRDQAMVLGAIVDPQDAAVTDQSDGWAVLRLAGPAALLEDALARLCPVDLRLRSFPPDSVARTMLHHMSCILIREDAELVDIMVFRSMTLTAVRSLEEAMRTVALRR